MLSEHKVGTPDYVVVLQRCSWRGDGALWALIDFEVFSILKDRM